MAEHVSDIAAEEAADNDDIGDEGGPDDLGRHCRRLGTPFHQAANKSTRDFMSLVEPSSSASNVRSSAEFGALQKEVEELRAKVRVLEKKAR